MRDHYNPWRLFCIDDEAGTVICDYPEGARKPSIPLSYAEETMHGFEYMLAAQMISRGMIDRGLELIAGVRDKYDGEKRNPFNEIECGNNYARSMATFSFIPLFEGFKFDLVHGMIGFDPIIKGDFRGLWSLDPAWGNVVVTDKTLFVNIIDGELKLKELGVPFDNVCEVVVDGRKLRPDEYGFAGKTVRFNSGISFKRKIEIR